VANAQYALSLWSMRSASNGLQPAVGIELATAEADVCAKLLVPADVVACHRAGGAAVLGTAIGPNARVIPLAKPQCQSR
jgi:hypothetical protein